VPGWKPGLPGCALLVVFLFRQQLEEDLVDAVAVHVDDFEAVAGPFDSVAGGGQAPEGVDDKAADGLVGAGFGESAGR
jgi:hypothetical protein